MSAPLSERGSTPAVAPSIPSTRVALLLLFLPVSFALQDHARASGFEADAPDDAALIPDGGQRIFTNKQGLKIEARVVAVGGSMRTVLIERPDGRRFDIEIVSLSLDDQQYLKDWLTAQPAPEPSTVSIRVDSEAEISETSRERFEDRIYGGSGTRSQLAYRFSIINQSRAPLLGVRLEYAVLLHDLVTIRPLDESGPEEVRWRARDQGPVLYRRGTIELDALKYNTELEVVTGPLDHEAIRGGTPSRGSVSDAEVGVLARLVTADGTVLFEHAEISHGYPQITWRDFEARRGTIADADADGEQVGELVDSVAAH